MDSENSARYEPCGGLLGCGDDSGRRYMVEPEAVDAALTPRTRDRLTHMDELDREALEPHLGTYRTARRRLVGAGGLLGLLAAIAPSGVLSACAAMRRSVG